MRKIFLFPTIDCLILGGLALLSIVAAGIAVIAHRGWTAPEIISMSACCLGFVGIFVAVMISKYLSQPVYQTTNSKVFVFEETSGMLVPTKKQLEFAIDFFWSFMFGNAAIPSCAGCKLFFMENKILWPFFGKKEGVQYLGEFYVHVQPTLPQTLALILHEMGHYIHGGNVDESQSDAAHTDAPFWAKVAQCLSVIMGSSGWRES